MFEEFRRDPSSVSESWRDFFQGYKPGGANLSRPQLASTSGLGEELQPGTPGARGADEDEDGHTGNGAAAGAPAATLRAAGSPTRPGRSAW